MTEKDRETKLDYLTIFGNSMQDPTHYTCEQCCDKLDNYCSTVEILYFTKLCLIQGVNSEPPNANQTYKKI